MEQNNYIPGSAFKQALIEEGSELLDLINDPNYDKSRLKKIPTEENTLELIPKKANIGLYCYFGQLGVNFGANVPGHNFYQLPLIESLCEKFNLDCIDFHSYLPASEKTDNYVFPGSRLGLELESIAGKYISTYCPEISHILYNIKNKIYSKLFLKARFRNISTITKKWDDAKQFEDLIFLALEVGYDPKDIIILDTDLSLTETLSTWLHEKGITILIPSIDFNPFTKRFLHELKDIHTNTEYSVVNKQDQLIYYGNLNFEKYKDGHAKNPIVFDCIVNAFYLNHFGKKYSVVLAGSHKMELAIKSISRANRLDIWDEFYTSKICLNVSKDLYVQHKFIPARVYEALMFGVLPVSYNMPFISELLSFSNVDEFQELAKFILELSTTEYSSIYQNLLTDFASR